MRDVGYDPVGGLAIEIHDPYDLADVPDRGIEDRFPDRALIELGVADERVLASPIRYPGDGLHIAPRDRTPNGRRRTDAHGACRVVHRVWVFRPARVALQAAEFAQLSQIRLI